MAINLDRNLLAELGLGSLPEPEQRALLSHIYETLEMRVGMRLADQMSNEQLDDFEKYFQSKDEAGAFHWLETNFPNYKDIVQEEFNKLKEEVRQSAPQILQAASVPVTNPAPASPAPGAPPAPQNPAPAYTPLQSPYPQADLTAASPPPFGTPPSPTQPPVFPGPTPPPPVSDPSQPTPPPPAPPPFGTPPPPTQPPTDGV